MQIFVFLCYSETLLFLHQIFFKGLCARLENWPTLVLGNGLIFLFYFFIISDGGELQSSRYTQPPLQVLHS